MYRILLPVDPDEERARRAAKTVTSLPGEANELEAVILNVHEETVIYDEGGSFNTLEVYDETTFPESVAVATELLDAAGIQTTHRREVGAPAEQIIRVADEIDADGIVISGRKQGTVGRVVFGSVTQSVLLNTDRTVIVAGETPPLTDE